MKRRITIDVDEEGCLTIEGGGDDIAPQVKSNILMAAAKKIRQAEGNLLQLIVFKDLKTQSVSIDFQKDEVKDWGEAMGMLEQAKRFCEFQSWFNMFMLANQQMAMQAQAAMQAEQVKQSVMGNGGRIFKGR
jgi:hypothetical protein